MLTEGSVESSNTSTRYRMSNFDIKGLDAIIKQLEKLPDEIAKQLVKEGMEQALEPMKEECERQAPTMSGGLKASFEVKAGKTKGDRVSAVVHIGEDNMIGGKFYAPFVIYGTSKQPGNNFMARAFDAKAEQVRDLAIESIQKLIDKETSGG